MNILRRWVRPAREGSGSVAKDRLRLVLVHNRLEMSADAMEHLKSDMLAVLERYFEIDHDSLVVDVQRSGHGNQLVTSISLRHRT